MDKAEGKRKEWVKHHTAGVVDRQSYVWKGMIGVAEKNLEQARIWAGLCARALWLQVGLASSSAGLQLPRSLHPVVPFPSELMHVGSRRNRWFWYLLRDPSAVLAPPTPSPFPSTCLFSLAPETSQRFTALGTCLWSTHDCTFNSLHEIRGHDLGRKSAALQDR